MAKPVFIRRWDDVGAPQITSGLNTELTDILIKCLVDGYGDKPGLGWTLALSENLQTVPKFILRNSPTNGSGGYLVVTSYKDINTEGMQIQSAVGFTAIDNLITPGYKQGVRFLGKLHSDGAPGTVQYPADKWILIGNDTGFYLLASGLPTYENNENYRYFPCFFAGDLTNTFNNDQGSLTAIVSAIGENGTPFSQRDGVGSGYGATLCFIAPSTQAQLNNGCALLQDVDLGGTGSKHTIDKRFFGSKFGSGYNATKNKMHEIYLLNRSDNDRDGVDVRVSTVAPKYRGTLPGFIELGIPVLETHEYPSFIKADDGGLYLILMSGESFNPPSNMIRVDEW